MANFDPTEASSSDIRAVARVGQILALFGPRVLELTAADVAERTGLNRTTAYRYCASMVAAGILERGTRRGTFALGGLMLELGIQALGRQRIVEIAGPHLRKLRTAVRMTAVLSIRGATEPVVALVEEDTSRMVVVTVHAGSKLDMTAAQTHLFLAYADPSALDAATEGMSAVDKARLESEIYSARRQGFSIARHSGGLFAMAAPVFDEQGMCATVAILGAGELDLATALDQLLATATALSDELKAPGEGPHADL
ncbi:IclR family transcriptional regulator [Micromonospora profundi]|uniref:Helix-turn-helix domain-containing protein n=1 Tax=Micromonospora profundi TaxID=1420889 RepID=A0AAJ6L0N3_9ACTN|nr:MULTISPECIES: helix-turn-helix domain-containing protein [Micromonospora]NJC11660.1 DNA-binding IclR family transcriptional regulator [Micromonospora profundi]WLS43560.1 helix-turn-helix domain-containing protein [Micromonospora profundi]